MHAVADQPDRDEPDLSVIEAIILPLEGRLPTKPAAASRDTPCLAIFVASFAGSNSTSMSFSYTH